MTHDRNVLELLKLRLLINNQKRKKKKGRGRSSLSLYIYIYYQSPFFIYIYNYTLCGGNVDKYGMSVIPFEKVSGAVRIIIIIICTSFAYQ